MAGTCFTLFDTAIGRCGIAWAERGIAGVQLPEARAGSRDCARFPEANEEPATRRTAAIDAIIALLAGEARELGD
jgi:methylated-DNA-[protein]-cysteine S-methyltransferase